MQKLAAIRFVLDSIQLTRLISLSPSRFQPPAAYRNAYSDEREARR